MKTATAILIALIVVIMAIAFLSDPCGWNVCESTIQEHIQMIEGIGK